MHPATRISLGVLLIAIGLLCMAPSARAYDDYGGCATCHGSFRTQPYTSLSDGSVWGLSLHDAHRATMLNADCRTCHQATGFYPVSLRASAGGEGLAPISCAGCHGRSEDDQGFLRGPGSGLRQHHFRAGLELCAGCHIDANPAAYTPVGENVPPPYYQVPGAGHPGIPGDPCNHDGSEDVAGGPAGLDNDGDLLYDTNDPDCPIPVPDIEVTPDSIDFGDVAVGTIAEHSYTIRNVGTALLTLSGVDIYNGSAQGEWGLQFPSSLILTPGQSMQLGVDFRPADAGAETATLRIDSDDPDTPQVSLPLSGVGVATPTTGLRVTPLRLDFAPTEIGGDSPLGVTLENLGTTALTVTRIELDPAGSPAFHLHDPTVPPLPFELSTGLSHSLEVAFSPPTAGSFTGTLIIVRQDPGSALRETIRVGLEGVGILGPHGDLEVMPEALAYGDVAVNGSSTRTLTLANPGNATLTIETLVIVASPEFHFVPAPPTTPFDLAAGTNVQLDMHFDPLDLGLEIGTLRIESTDPHTPTREIALSGTGIAPPAISVTPATVTFPTTYVGSGTARPVTIRNTGASPLSITDLIVSGAEFDPLSYTPQPPFAIPPGSAVLVWITYYPTDVGVDDDSLRIESNDPVGPSMLVPLHAEGIPLPAPDIELAPASLDFGDVLVGSTSPALDVTILNVGAAPLTIPGVGIDSQVGVGTYTRTGFTGGIINPGGMRVVSVQFLPQAIGASEARLFVRSNDPVTPRVSIGIGGQGVAMPAPSIEVLPLSLDFGDVDVGMHGHGDLLIRNAGGGPLTITGFDLGGHSEFLVDLAPQAPPFQLDPGQQVTIVLAYAPVDAGEDLGTLTVRSDDVTRPAVDVALRGNGLQLSRLLDIDFESLMVMPIWKSGDFWLLWIDLRVTNGGSVAGDAPATVSAVQDGVEIYRETRLITVGLEPGVSWFKLPWLWNDSAAPITWTVSIEDQDPDDDTHTAVKLGPGTP